MNSITPALKKFSGLIVLGLFVYVSNMISSGNTLASMRMPELTYINPERAQSIVELIAPYTQAVDEEVSEVAVAFAAEQEGEYIGKDINSTTEKTKLESEYTVQKGDTMSNIASKFNLHVATILNRNGIKVENIEKLSPGQLLIIPVSDTSDSQDWLVQLNTKKEKDRQLAAQKAAQAKKKLSSANRTVVARDRAGYDGASDGSWGTPISYKYISRGISRGHAGIDMVASVGITVYSAKAGRVVEITRNWGSGYGNSIVIDHGAGQTSRYAHLSDFAVGLGDTVSQGQVIGYSGNTGWSTGPHLHFEARQNGSSFNPF